jgi:UDP-glucose 4-epimerase
VVYAGTRQVYGHPRYLPVDENHPIEPVDYNGISKFAGEQFHLVAQRVHGLPACSLRMTNVYGPRMRCRDGRQTFLGVWIRRLIEGQPIPVYGSGTQVRDLNFVEDAVDALLIAAACPSSDGETYNLGSPEPVRLIDLADLMIAINGSGSRELLPFPEERRRIEIGDYHGDYGKIQSQLGWEPRVSLREGLARTLAFYRQKCEHYW